jgi:hypothetical protein
MREGRRSSPGQDEKRHTFPEESYAQTVGLSALRGGFLLHAVDSAEQPGGGPIRQSQKADFLYYTGNLPPRQVPEKKKSRLIPAGFGANQRPPPIVAENGKNPETA